MIYYPLLIAYYRSVYHRATVQKTDLMLKSPFVAFCVYSDDANNTPCVAMIKSVHVTGHEASTRSKWSTSKGKRKIKSIVPYYMTLGHRRRGVPIGPQHFALLQYHATNCVNAPCCGQGLRYSSFHHHENPYYSMTRLQ